MRLFVTDPAVVHLGVRFLRLVSLFYLMPALTNGIQGFFRGMGDLKVTLNSSTLNMGFHLAQQDAVIIEGLCRRFRGTSPAGRPRSSCRAPRP